MSKPVDRVQILKRETTAGGGDASDVDDFFTESPLDAGEDAPDVAGVYFQEGSDRDKVVVIYREDNKLYFEDTDHSGVDRVCLGDLSEVAGGGITASQHKALRHAIHFLPDGPGDGFSSGAFKEVIGGIFPTNITWYASSSKAEKVFEKVITRSGGGATVVAPTPIVYKMYDSDGSTVLVTITDDIVYSSIFEVSRTRIIT